MATATRTTTATRTLIIFTHDPEGVQARFNRMARKGVKGTMVTESHARQGQRVLAVTVKVGSEAEREALKLQRRGEELTRIGEAIREGRAYLDTAWGRRKVVSYNDRTGDAVTRNDGEDRFFGQRTFMVSLEAIRIETAGGLAAQPVAVRTT